MTYKRHPIETIEGIGAAWGEKLRAADITATEDLLELSEVRQNIIMKNISGFPVAKMRKFIAAAEFLLLDSFTGQQAEAFIAAGRQTLIKLSAPDPSTLVEELEEAKVDGLIPKEEKADLREITRWQKQAIKIQLTGFLLGSVSNDSGPVEGATVYCDNQEAITDETGKFYLPIAPFGQSKVVIRAEGYKRFNTLINVSLNSKKVKLAVTLQPGEVVLEELSESDDQPIRKIFAEDRIRFIQLEISDIADDTPFIFKSFKKNGKAKLNGANRERKGNEIQISRIYAPKESLDETAVSGDIFLWKNGQFVRSQEKLGDIRANVFFKSKTMRSGRKVEIKRIRRL